MKPNLKGRWPVLVLLVSALSLFQGLRAQCDPTVPTFYADLSGSPDSVWLSMDTARKDNCCSTSSPDQCIRFVVTLDSDASGITFDLYSGTIPSGSLSYQIGCGTTYAVGEYICLSGPGPHEITFCEPGTDKNVYRIRSVPKPGVSPPIIVSGMCIDTLFTTGLIEDSIVWRSITNNPVYNSYLSDTAGEDTVTVTPSGSYPSYVDYEVCGRVLGSCGVVNYCDTVRVTFVSNFTVTILPDDPMICFGGSPVEIYAAGSGGVTPYSYLWSTGATTDTIPANKGIYSVMAIDSLGCSAVYDTVAVDSFSAAITANAGTDTFMCRKQTSIALNGTVTGVSTGTWLGGDGVFSPSADTTNITYSPGSSDLASGQVILSLLTTGNLSCPGDTDQVLVQLPNYPAPAITGADTACENKIHTYSLFDPQPGETFSWTVTGGSILGPSNDSFIQVLWAGPGTGNIGVTQTSAIGCDSTVSINVTIVSTPAPEIHFPNDTACENKIHTYWLTSSSPTHSYQWSVVGGNVLGGSNDTVIQVLWGASGTGYIQVTQYSAFGCDSTILDSVTITPTPKPVISLPNDTACQNKRYNYSVTPLAGASYLWSVAGGQIIGDSTGSGVEVLWGTSAMGSIQVTQISAFGCDSTVRDSVTLVATPLPVITGNDSVCQNGIHSYSVASVAGHTYQWFVTGGSLMSSGNSQSVDVLWLTPGTGTLRVVQTSSFGCDSSDLDSIRVFRIPEPHIVGEDTVCQDKVMTYHINRMTSDSYLWSVSGGTILSVNTDTFVIVQWGSSGTGQVGVTQTSDFGCDSFTSIPVLIRSTPQLEIAGDTAPCRDKVYSYSVTPAAGHYYTWTLSGGHFISATDQPLATVIWDTSGWGYIELTMVSPEGCDSTVRDSVMIYPTPRTSITGSDTFCENETGVYRVDYDPAWTYSWNISGGQVLGASDLDSVTVLWNTPGLNNVAITIIHSSGCDTVISQYPVRIHDKPAPVINGPTITCRWKTYSYHTSLQSNHLYQWQVEGGYLIGSSADTTITVLWDSSSLNLIRLTMTNADGCDSTVEVPIQVMPTPVPKISGPLKPCANGLYSYHANLSNGAVTGITNFQWQVSGGSIAGPDNLDSVVILWNNAGPGIVSLRTITTAACDSTVTLPVQIKSVPAPTINGPDSSCQNKVAAYNTNFTSGHHYVWSVTNGVILGSDTAVFINVFWNTPGIGTLELYEINESGCDSILTKEVTLLPSPVPLILGDTPVCSESIHNYSVTAVPGSSYEWQVNGGTILGADNGSDIVVQWGNPGYGSLRIRQVSALGCDSIRTLTLRINPKPRARIIGARYTCDRSPGKYYRESYQVPGKPSIQYNWSTVGGTILGSSNLDSVVIAWGSNGEHPVYLRATDTETGCSSADTFYAEVGDLAEPSILIQPYTGCIPFDLDLREGSGEDSLDYTWEFQGTNLQGSKLENPIYTINFADTFIIRLVVKNKYGCIDTAYSEVLAQANPDAKIDVMNRDSIFLEDSAYFINLTKSEVLEYRWDFHDGEVSYDFEPSKYYPLPGNYSVRMIASTSNGCSDTTHLIVPIRVVPDVYVPNAFTPNGDDNNDYLNIETFYVVEGEFQVLNRWGETIFISTDLNFKWDGYYNGVPVREDVYIYYFKGRDFNNDLIVRKGSVVVIR